MTFKTKQKTNTLPSNNLNIVIFSKNRALQLESLLRSILDNFSFPIKSTTILYKSTTDVFSNGYNILKHNDLFKSYIFYEEVDFKNDLISIINQFEIDSKIMFLVDDDVFFKNIDISNLISSFSNENLFISLRADRSYQNDMQPKFIKNTELLKWKWYFSRGKIVTWNYPFSVDGNIFHTSVINKILSDINFSAPNSLEGNMHSYRKTKWVKKIKTALAPRYSVVVNNPLNKVQSEGDTWHQSICVEELNNKLLNGYRINNKALYKNKPNSIHYPMDIVFEKKAN